MTDEMTDDVQAQDDPGIEPEAETPADEPERSPMADHFEAMFPGMQYDEIKPEQREAMYQFAMKAQANRPDPPSQREPAADAPAPGNLEALSQLTRDRFTAVFQKLANDGDAEAAADEMMKVVGAVKELPGVVNQVYDRLDGDVTSMRLKQDLVEARSGVKGAMAADVPLAMRVLQEGRATKADDALRLVVFDRLTATPRRSANDDAKRAARAMAASAAAQGGDPDGYSAQAFPQTVEEEEELKLKEFQAGKLVSH